MTVVTTIDVYDMPNSEYRAVLDRMGVEARPSPLLPAGPSAPGGLTHPR
jgi:hypothetical protein